MSRFNNPKALSNPPRESLTLPARESRPETESVVPALPRVLPPTGATGSLVLPPSVYDCTLGQQAGFAVFCVFAVSGYANEFAVRLFHVKAYISTVSWVLLPLLLILSGNLLRGLRDIIGRLWLVFLVWICLAVPFSVWKGGSAALLVSYIPHAWIQLYYYAAFLISVPHYRRFMFFSIAANFFLLLDCFLFGAMADGRFEIPQSMFFTNANDLALQLLIAITQFMYLIYQRQVWKQVFGAAALLVALMYMLKTASRGAFLATLVLAAVTLVFTKNRMAFVLIGIPVALVALLLVPASVLHRLKLMAVQPETITVSNLKDESAVASQMQRIKLFQQSVEYAVTHPLVGVGPGQFAVAAFGDSVKEGTRASWLGTHNSYTEVASECGIPAFVLYLSVIVISLVSNFRIFRRTPHLAEYSDLSALAFCLFCSTLVYAICTFFFHIAYSGYLPVIAGMSIALRLGTDPSLWRSKAPRLQRAAASFGGPAVAPVR